MVQERLKELLAEAEKLMAKADNKDAVERLRVKYLGRKGELTKIFKSIPDLPDSQKPLVGKSANIAKNKLEKLIKEAFQQAEEKPQASPASFDPTIPGAPPPLGHIHPLTHTIEEVSDIFRTMGFTVAEGPEVEKDWYNFEALNIPPDHPSRDDFDTFYVSDHILLRSQTSTVQIRTMEKNEPPVRIIAPGRCFRPDTEDARHSAMFHQIEGLMVDENVSFGDLKAILHIFAREFFHEDVEVRFRPSFFPFTEPSAEVDCTCPVCSGDGCSTCSYSGWLEILGAGMVDPNVFDSVGFDKEKYTGFAFGMGIERLAMLKYRINDIRLFFNGDTRFLSQFSL